MEEKQSEHIEAVVEKPAPAKKAKPRRVEVFHPKMRGAAHPLEKDLDKWLDAGWKAND